MKVYMLDMYSGNDYCEEEKDYSVLDDSYDYDDIYDNNWLEDDSYDYDG